MRTPSVSGGRPTVVSVRLSQAEIRRLDALRRGFSRSTYLRLLLRAEGGHQGADLREQEGADQ